MYYFTRCCVRSVLSAVRPPIQFSPLVAAIVSTAHSKDSQADAGTDSDDQGGSQSHSSRALGANTFSRRRAFTKYLRRKER